MLTLVVNVLIKNYYTDSGDVRSGDGNNTPVDGDVVQDEVSMKSVPSAELGSQEGSTIQSSWMHIHILSALNIKLKDAGVQCYTEPMLFYLGPGLTGSLITASLT